MKIITYKGAVQTAECDSNQHMNVQFYINKFELAGRQFSMELGIRNDFLIKNNIGVAVLEQNIKYQKEVFEDDLLYIKSELEEFTAKVYSVRHIMYNSETNEQASEMLAKLVLFDKAKRKAIVLPEEIQQQMQKMRAL